MNAIEAYASLTSVSPAIEVINFHVSVQSSDCDFQIDIYRRGIWDTPLLSDRGQGSNVGIPPDASINGCGWPVSYALTVPIEWKSGVYVAHLTAVDGNSTDVLFVVKAADLGRNSKILFQIVVNTSQAYNNWGGRSLYGYNSGGDDNRARWVSFDRPGIEGSGSDEGGSDSPFSSYEYRFVQWLEQNGFEVDYCTSIDLHRDPQFLDNYQLLLSVGHDEYWSKEMRDSVERFVANGGNFAIFGGNVCWWQVYFSEDLRQMFCYRYREEDPLTGTDNERVTVNWWDDPVLRPGNTMTGVDSRHGAYWQGGDFPPAVDYKVLVPNHWVFDGALSGNMFGADLHIVGYETDAADLTDYSGNTLPRATGMDGTPLNFVCLAIADCQDWGVLSGGTSGWATMGIYHNNGTVFTTATTNWSAGLSLDGNWTAVDQITQNVLRRLMCPCPPAPHLINAGFEQYDNDGRPIGWTLEGAGYVGPGAVNIGHTSLEVVALNGQTWISQGPFLLEVRNYYVAGCWARAHHPGATLRLQSMESWLDFAVAEHPGDGNWHYLHAVGLPNNSESPVFPARVKIQVAQGSAQFDSVQVNAIPPRP
jgi:hypothetical protein